MRPLRTGTDCLTGSPSPPAVQIIRTTAARDGLAAITRPGTELVIWQRHLPTDFTQWIANLDPGLLPDTHLVVSPEDCRRALAPVFEECSLPAGSMRDLLLNDIAELAATYAAITRTGRVDIRLNRISHDACWKFHRDYVDFRLLTTYRGPGTEWVDPAHAESALAGQQDYTGPINRLAPHDVALFRGCGTTPGQGILHRSPPISTTPQTRLLLCLNRPSEVSPADWRG